jgi:hypothetical protein
LGLELGLGVRWWYVPNPNPNHFQISFSLFHFFVVVEGNILLLKTPSFKHLIGLIFNGKKTNSSIFLLGFPVVIVGQVKTNNNWMAGWSKPLTLTLPKPFSTSSCWV